MLYSVHYFDGAGREDTWEELDCASEAEAINTMLDHAKGRAAELWDEDRRLIWWPAEGLRGHTPQTRQRAWRRATIDTAVSAPEGI
jgi:hypothetical protein